MPDRRVTVTHAMPKRLAITLEAPTVPARKKLAASLRAALYRIADDLQYDMASRRYTARYGAHKHLWDWAHQTFEADEIYWHADTPEWRLHQDKQERAQFERERAEWRRQHGKQSGVGPATALEQALAFFHVTPDAPLWVAEAVYRAAAARYHPDKQQGDEQKMRRINEMIAVIRKGKG